MLTGFSVGRLDAWGISLDDWRAANPALITCSASGFGPNAGHSDLKCYEGVVAAKAGYYNRGDFGFRDGPIFSGGAVASSGCAQMAFSGILAALFARETTGRGQHLDATMFAGLTPIDYFGTGRPQGTASDRGAHEQ